MALGFNQPSGASIIFNVASVLLFLSSQTVFFLAFRGFAQIPDVALPASDGPRAAGPAPLGSFVTRDGAQFQLDGKPFYFTGANFYSAMVNAAGGDHTREQTTKVFQMMQKLGLTVLRTWAFNDFGVNNTWQALQTKPEEFDELVFSNGLDWIISEAPKYGVRLLLALTNYQLGYGGAYQYVQWAGGNNILDFYTNPIIDKWYKTNVRTILTRVNSITGIAYSDDPAIFGWELANEPRYPGDDTGKLLTEWITDNSNYIRSLDSNHLIGTGSEGFYGASTPDRLTENPAPGTNPQANGGAPAPYAVICEGEDFVENHSPENIDFTSIHLYPDYWASSNLTFQLQFSETYIQGHIEESAKLQKPLVIGEFGKYPPLAARNIFFKEFYKIAIDNAASGGALAGTMIWSIGSSPEFPYVNGYDAFNVYINRTAYLEAPPGNYTRPTEAAMKNAVYQEFYAWANQTECNAKYATNPRGLLRDAPSADDGWDETLNIIRKAARATSRGVHSYPISGYSELEEDSIP